MREFTLGHQDESRSRPGGRLLVGKAANLCFESACYCFTADPNGSRTGSQLSTIRWHLNLPLNVTLP